MPSGKANVHDTWMQFLHVTSGRAQWLSEWPDKCNGHVLLHIDIPNQQVYPLPLLITPLNCVYLITFDLPEGKEEVKKALKAIRDTLKDVYAYSEAALGANLGGPKSEVFLVGLQTEEKDWSSFSEQLNRMLETRSYEKLIVRTKSNDPFWTHNGAELRIHDDAALLCRIKGSCCPPTQLIRQSRAFHCKLLQKFKDNPLVLCKDLEAENDGALAIPDSSNLEQSLNVLHSFGFILYCSLPGLEQSEKVVVLQPQYLRQLFELVQERSEERMWFATADLLGIAGKHIRDKQKWFVAMCTSMGLVIELSIKGRSDHVFVMGLKRECDLPERTHYSVDPLLVTYCPPDVEQMDGLLPSPLFPTFVTTFLKNLEKKLKKTIAMKQHYLYVSVEGSTQIHVVERDAFIEIGLQQFHVGIPYLSEGEQLEKLQKSCQGIYSIVTKSAESATTSLRLDVNNLQYGFLCHPESSEPVDHFSEFDTQDGILTCSCCNAPQDPTPQQQIWISNVDHQKVCNLFCVNKHWHSVLS